MMTFENVQLADGNSRSKIVETNILVEKNLKRYLVHMKDAGINVVI